jgi:hypothetical protein
MSNKTKTRLSRRINTSDHLPEPLIDTSRGRGLSKDQLGRLVCKKLHQFFKACAGLFKILTNDYQLALKSGLGFFCSADQG